MKSDWYFVYAVFFYFFHHLLQIAVANRFRCLDHNSNLLLATLFTLSRGNEKWRGKIFGVNWETKMKFEVYLLICVNNSGKIDIILAVSYKYSINLFIFWHTQKHFRHFCCSQADHQTIFIRVEIWSILKRNETKVKSAACIVLWEHACSLKKLIWL